MRRPSAAATPLSQSLLDWYAQHARRLPWRGAADPYAIWVSEIMLQQTRVETVLPYFARWMEALPDITSLANAPLQQVLSLWEGLGYYSRARNLHKAAKTVAEEYGGRLPASLPALRKLPGIGRYTAAAIASMAFGQDEATLDGNIRRVLARVFDLRLPARSPAGERQLWAWAAEHLPAGQAGDYNQAWMDLGAQICLPRQPRCPDCPIQAFCLAFQLGVQNERPILAEKTSTPHYTVTAAVLRAGERILLAQRPMDGLLGGMWEFPGGKTLPQEELVACLQREIQEELGVEVSVGAEVGVYRHAYTHMKVTLHAFECQLLAGSPENKVHRALRWVSLEELGDYPMGKIDRQIARDLQGRQNDPG